MILVNPVLKLVILYHLLTTGVPDYLSVFIQILSQVIFLSLKFSRDLIQCTLNMMVSRSRFLIGSWRVHYGAHSTRAHSYFIKEVKILAVLCRIIKFLGIFRTLEKCREREMLLLILLSCSTNSRVLYNCAQSTRVPFLFLQTPPAYSTGITLICASW